MEAEKEASPAPWLVFPCGKGKKNQALYNLCEPNNTNCRKFIPELSRKTFWQKPSHQGWLIVLCDVKDEDSDDDDEKFDNSMPNWTYGDCFLWNPVTLQTIQLPNLLHWITKPNAYQLFDCILSSPPGGVHKSGDSPVPVVVFLFRQEDEGFDHVFVFCNPGDKQWRTQLLSRDIININQLVSLHCFRGKLYAMGLEKEHLEIHLLGANHNNVSLALRPFKVRFCGFFQFRGARGESMCLVHFVEGCDEFFKININYNERGFEKVVTSILVMRLDFTLMQLKVVSCLGNHVLFAGRNTAYCFISDLGLTRGCLYYTLPEDQGLYKFDIEDTAESVILPCPQMPAPWFSSSWITLPNGRGRKEGASGKDEEEKCHILEEGKKTSTIRSYDETVNKNENASQVEKHNPRHSEEEKPWCILNGDMVQLIASYLHPVDYVHFRSINKANREVMPVVKSRFIHTTQTFETGNLFPWLVFSRDNSSAIYNFINPIHNNENHLIKFSELLVGATIRYQKDGWLLISREKELFFYNPFTRETIQLADFPGCHYLSDISFSSLPTAPDCIVFGIDRSGVGASITIYTIRRGEQQWDFFSLEEFDVEKDSASQNTPTLFDGVFYSVGYDGTLNKLNLLDDTYELLQKPHIRFNDSYPSFLVKCGEDLLLVKLRCPKMLVRIYRMDFSKMEWVKVESLGKHMLFISDITCFSAIAPNCRMENKVYFPRIYLDGEGILCYSLETGSYHSFGGTSQHSANNIYGTKGWHSNCSWIQPNWSKSTAQELDWMWMGSFLSTNSKETAHCNS